MPPELLAAAKKAEEELSPEERSKRKRFHERLGALRSMNKKFSAVQRTARLQRKSSRSCVHKSRFVALKITVILNMMLEMKGTPLTHVHRVFCHDKRCNKHRCALVLEEKRVTHNIRDEDRIQAKEFRKEIRLLLDLEEFVEEHKDR